MFTSISDISESDKLKRDRSPLHYASRYLWATIAALSPLLTGCVDIEGPIAKKLTDSEILQDVRISSKAIMMAVNDSIRMEVEAIAMDESIIEIDPLKVKWRSGDQATLTVDQNGTIRSKLITEQAAVPVFATYTHERVTKTDTILVTVTETRLQATSVKLVAVDSNRVGSQSLMQPRIRVDLYRGDTLVFKGAQIPINAPLPTKVEYSPFGGPAGEPVYTVDNLSRLGSFWLTISTNLYGAEVEDSLEMIGLYPAMANFVFLFPNEEGGFNPNEFNPNFPAPLAQPCAWFLIVSFAPMPVDIVFSDSTATEDGCSPLLPENIPIDWISVGLIQTGGNIIGAPPFALTIRRSSTRGIITAHLRDHVTKARIPVSMRWKSADYTE